MKLKKIASLMLAGIMAVSMLAGCKSDSANGNNNDDNTVVVPSTSAVVTALNNGQSADNDVKVAFSSNASFDAALKKAVENAGNYDDGDDVLTELLNLLGEKNEPLFDENSNNNAMKDGMAVVDASGAKREISTELLENVEPGDYVMVHAGIAIAKIQEDEEEEADELLEELL